MRRTAIVISIASGIGDALAGRLAAHDWKVGGTLRKHAVASAETDRFKVACDLDSPIQIDQACRELVDALGEWDALILCPGTLEPIGPFEEVEFQAWEDSFAVNFFGQLRIVRNLLRHKNPRSPKGASVIFFAGGGSNGAPVNYSAYTIAKIALTKMCELLDAENPDCRFTILGPGWVDTKIHQETLRAGKAAGKSLERTEAMISEGGWVPMAKVLDCVEWVLESPRERVGGRNFSVAHDAWSSGDLNERLQSDANMYKLRRHRNDG